MLRKSKNDCVTVTVRVRKTEMAEIRNGAPSRQSQSQSFHFGTFQRVSLLGHFVKISKRMMMRWVPLCACLVLCLAAASTAGPREIRMNRGQVALRNLTIDSSKGLENADIKGMLAWPKLFEEPIPFALGPLSTLKKGKFTLRAHADVDNLPVKSVLSSVGEQPVPLPVLVEYLRTHGITFQFEGVAPVVADLGELLKNPYFPLNLLTATTIRMVIKPVQSTNSKVVLGKIGEWEYSLEDAQLSVVVRNPFTSNPVSELTGQGVWNLPPLGRFQAEFSSKSDGQCYWTTHQASLRSNSVSGPLTAVGSLLAKKFSDLPEAHPWIDRLTANAGAGAPPEISSSCNPANPFLSVQGTLSSGNVSYQLNFVPQEQQPTSLTVATAAIAFKSSSDDSSPQNPYAGSRVTVALATERVEFRAKPWLRFSPSLFPELARDDFLPAGCTVLERLRVNKDFCDSNSLCSWIDSKVVHLTGKGIAVKSTVDKGQTVRLAAQMEDIPISPVADLHDVSLDFDSDGNGTIIDLAVRGTLRLRMADSGRVVSFTGSLSASNSGRDVSLLMASDETWSKAFGWERLTIQNPLLQGRIDSQSGKLRECQLGASIAYGQDCVDEQTGVWRGDGRCFGVQSFVGMDLDDSSNNFAYSSLANVSLQILATAFGPQGSDPALALRDLPSWMREIRLSGGSSIASKRLELPNGVIILPGVRFFGNSAVAGLSGRYDVQVRENTLDLSLDFHPGAPISFASGSIVLTETLVGDGLLRGPHLVVDCKTGACSLTGLAAVHMLGLNSTAALRFVDGNIEFGVKGKLYNGSLVADVQAKGIVNVKDFNATKFQVHGTVVGFEDLQVLVTEILRNMVQDAHQKVLEVEGKVERELQKVSDLRNKMCGANSCKTQVCTKSTEVCSRFATKQICDKWDDVCASSEKKCSGWSDKCVESTKKCADWLPSWLGGLCKAWNTVCTKSEKICNGWVTVCTKSSQVCSKTSVVVDRTVCEAYDKVCDATDWVVDKTCDVACAATSKALELADSALEKSEKLLNTTLDRAGFFDNLLKRVGGNLGSIRVVIQSIVFDIFVERDFVPTTFTAQITGSVLDKHFSVPVDVDWRDLDATARNIAKKISDAVKNQ